MRRLHHHTGSAGWIPKPVEFPHSDVAIATGKPAFVGEASVELRATDAGTGTVLFEAVDSRVGTKNPMAIWDKWEDVDTAFAYWADRLGYRLCMERGATGCVAP